MTATPNIHRYSDRELILTRLIDAPSEKLYRHGPIPSPMKQWFAAVLGRHPMWKTRSARRSQHGRHARSDVTSSNRGVYLESSTKEKLVFTDATPGVGAVGKNPFIDGDLNFEGTGGKDEVHRSVLHWTVGDARRMKIWPFTNEAGARATTSLRSWCANLIAGGMLRQCQQLSSAFRSSVSERGFNLVCTRKN